MKLFDYQKMAIEKMIEKSIAILADPGAGKTLIALNVIKHFNKRTLIIAPLRVCEHVWPNEIKKWGFDFECHFAKSTTLQNDKLVTLINPEAFIRVKDLNIFKQFEILIVDESTKFKSSKSVRFKTLKKILGFFKRKYILTGTPIPNGLLDFWAQSYIVDTGKSLDTSITRFRNQYFDNVSNTHRFPIFKIKKDADKKIFDKMLEMSLRIDMSTMIELPDIIYNDIFVSMTKDEYNTYLDAEKGLVVDCLSDIKLRHLYITLANGFYYDDNKNVKNVHCNKIFAIKDLLDDLHHKPVMIAYKYIGDYVMLSEAFPNAVAITSSGAIDKWNNKKIDILLCHPQAVGHGLNLQNGGNDIIWFSLTDDLEAYLQFNKRLHRQGIEGKVRIHHILTKNTIDEILIKVLREKGDTQTALLNYIRDRQQLSNKHINSSG